ncbi:RNA-binding domain-containing protein, partial [Neoconidiobolus thromboides FSU 785]
DSDNQIPTIYISKLSFKTTEETLIGEFSKYGKIANCHLVVDPHTKESRGFAFITFEDIEEADNAVAKCANLILDGSPLVVEKSRRTKPRSPTPGRYSG